MTDIFISYSKEDSKVAGRLAQIFSDQGYTVFWDREIPAGSTWRDVIGKALGEAKIVVTLWTRNSTGSRWVIEESEFAANKGNLVPLLCENVEIPMGLRSIQAANFINWRGEDDAPELTSLIASFGAALETNSSSDSARLPSETTVSAANRPIWEKRVRRSLW